jgi:hypothetical protein
VSGRREENIRFRFPCGPTVATQPPSSIPLKSRRFDWQHRKLAGERIGFIIDFRTDEWSELNIRFQQKLTEVFKQTLCVDEHSLVAILSSQYPGIKCDDHSSPNSRPQTRSPAIHRHDGVTLRMPW